MSLLPALLKILFTGYMLSSVILLGGLALPAYSAIARRQLNVSNLVLLLASMVVVVSAVTILFSLLTARTEEENYLILNRIWGPYWFFYWGSFLCQGILPQLFWFRRWRRSPTASTLVALGLMVDFSSYLFLSLGRADYLPSSWEMRPSYLPLLTCALLYLALLAVIAALQRWRNAAASC